MSPPIRTSTDTLSRALNKLIEGLPDLKKLGQLAKFKKKDKITDAVAKAGRELAKLVQKFIVRPLAFNHFAFYIVFISDPCPF